MKRILNAVRKSRWLAAAYAAAVLAAAAVPVSAFAAADYAGQYIGETKAKSVALADAGLLETQVSGMRVRLDREDGVRVYEVDFRTDRTKYEYDLDAASGDILKADLEIRYAFASSGSASGYAPYIGEAAAKAAALADAGLLETQVSGMKAKLDREHGVRVYEVKFRTDRTKYEYELDAVSGTILKVDLETRRASATGNGASGSAGAASGAYIGEARAKAVALADAGLSEMQVRKIKAELDRERGVMVYEVEFKSGWMEYEYDIDAVSGAILKSDIEYDD